jgi:hypothetical protein
VLAPSRRNAYDRMGAPGLVSLCLTAPRDSRVMALASPRRPQAVVTGTPGSSRTSPRATRKRRSARTFSPTKRRGRDSNPRGTKPPLTVFETAPFNHSGTPPEQGEG